MRVSANNRIYAGKRARERLVPQSRTRKVLLVEEQAHVLRVIRLNLERCGFHVDVAETADAALQLMMEQTFDALILTGDRSAADTHLLCKRGSELLAATNTGEDGTPAPLMLVSCNGQELTADMPFGYECLGMPVSLKRIVYRLQEVLLEPGGRLVA